MNNCPNCRIELTTDGNCPSCNFHVNVPLICSACLESVDGFYFFIQPDGTYLHRACYLELLAKQKLKEKELDNVLNFLKEYKEVINTADNAIASFIDASNQTRKEIEESKKNIAKITAIADKANKKMLKQYAKEGLINKKDVDSYEKK